VASELGRHLARRGHSVHFITYDLPFRVARFVEGVFFHEVEVPAYPLFKHPPYLLSLASKMVEVSRNERLDILHVHYAIPHATSAVLARQVLEAAGDGPPPAVITTLHGTDITLIGSEPSFADLVAFSIQKSDGVTAVSEALRRQTLEVFRTSVGIRTIYNFVDPDDYGPARAVTPAKPAESAPTPDIVDEVAQCRRLLASEDEAVVTHISNFRPVKRAELVVRIFAAACRDVPSKLVLIGDGPDLAKVRREAVQLGLAGRLVYLGNQERVEGLLASSDVFLLPSLQESFGLAALEAMAAGTPVIASRVGGLPEVVGEEGGRLFDPDDFDGMVRGLRDFLTDRALRESWGAKARRRAFRLFSSDIIVPQYEKYYAEVLEAVRARPETADGGGR
jgi:N-acetyl-alpha-D-glucosaminyl L-malate synthase BshA